MGYARSTFLALGLIACAGQAHALYIPFQGTVDTAGAMINGAIGSFPVTFTSSTFTGAIGTNALGQFYAALQLPSFTSDGPGCNLPQNGCSVFSSPGTYSVTDDGSISSMSSFQQTGNVVTFSVFDAIEGSISGTIDLGLSTGSVSADLRIGPAFRADNNADLTVNLQVAPVPLPGAAPMFGAALLVVGFLARGLRRSFVAGR